MNLKHTILTTALLSVAAAGAAQAQSSGATNSVDKGGQMSVPNQDKGSKPRPSATGDSRAEVKAEAAAATASGTARGEQSTPTQGKKPMAAPPSQTSRAEVKAGAAAARKAGSAPAGQESVKDQNKGGAARP